MKKLAIAASVMATVLLASSVVFYTQAARSRDEINRLSLREEAFCFIWSSQFNNYIDQLKSAYRIIREHSAEWLHHYEHITQDFSFCRPEMQSWLFTALESCARAEDVDCMALQLKAAAALASAPSPFVR